MIRAFTFSVSLALALLALALPSASAVSLAECQAYLCMPGGFPPSECSPAKAAVMRRLAQLKPALPSWSSCASQFGWDSANLSHTERWHDRCPRGGTYSNDICSGVAGNGCAFSYTAQKRVTVQVVVDGATAFSPNHTHTQTVAHAGTPTWTCPPGVDPPPLPYLPPHIPPPPGGDDDDGDGGCANPPCDDDDGGGCANPPCDDDDGGGCANPPCDDDDGGDGDDCSSPVAGPGARGGRPGWYRVRTSCGCPAGYPFTWPVDHMPDQMYCLQNPGRPGN